MLTRRSEPGNELAELLWENGPAFRRTAPQFPASPFPPFTCGTAATTRAQELVKNYASTVMRDLLPVQGDADDAVPWLHYPIVDGDGDSETVPLPPEYCAGLLEGYHDLPAVPVPALAPAAVATRAARAPSTSHAVPPPEPAVLKQPRPGGESVMNFSFFSRALQRPAGGDRASAAATASNPVESTVVRTAVDRLRSTPLFSEQRMAWLQPPAGSRTTVAAAPPPAPLVPSRQVESSAALSQRLQSEARAPEPLPVAAAMTTSSVCSDNGDRSELKRSSHQLAEWSVSQDDDSDDEPGALTRSAGRSTKRGRTAEVHNMSERRRRDRINEKMRALQELIPNCNKIDKASMLEEAIEYLKTLQLQVQMMSMGTGMCMPPMMMMPAAAMQHMQMSHFHHHLGAMGMGLGLGFGMGAFDPRVAGAQFQMMPGSAALPMFGNAMPSPAPFPHQAGHMANIISNAALAEQTPSEAAARGGADTPSPR